MAFTIAMAGKGGVGKTTLAGFLIRYLLEKNKKPILAVDADANANLNDVLGLEVQSTVGAAREEMKRGVPTGITKDVFMELKIGEALVESEGFDLLVMGRPEGEGCYCAANTLLAGFIDKLTGNYPFIVIDNEAGMEHLSRLNAKDVDLFLIVSDTSRRGIQAAIRIDELARELNIVVKKRALIVNRARSNSLEMLRDMFPKDGLQPTATIPEDAELEEFDFKGKPSFHLPKGNACLEAAFRVFDGLLE